MNALLKLAQTHLTVSEMQGNRARRSHPSNAWRKGQSLARGFHDECLCSGPRRVLRSVLSSRAVWWTK